MNPIAPSVAEGFDLFGFAGDVVGLAVFHIAAGGGPLEVAVEFDAVGRVEVDALHLAAQALAFGEAGHDLEGVAEEHAVRPILVVLVEVGFFGAVGDAVEVVEEVELGDGGGGLRLAEEVVHEGLGVDFFLNVEGRGVDDEVAPVLLVLAAPDELGVEVGIAWVADLAWFFLLLVEDGLVLGGGDVFPLLVEVGEGLDGLGGGWFLGHGGGLYQVGGL